MHLWRIYLWTFSVIVLLSGIGRLVLFFKKPGAVSKMDLAGGAVGIVAIPALLGFAYQRPCGLHLFWQLLTLVLGGLSVYEFFTPKVRALFTKSIPLGIGLTALQIALGGPALFALFRYSFFEPALWSH